MSLSQFSARYRRFRTVLKEISSETVFAWSLVIPATLITTAIIIYPILKAIYMSFFNVSFIDPTDMAWVGLENYRTILSDPTFRVALRNTIILTVSTVSLQYILGLGLAMLLKQPLPGMKWVRTGVLLAWVTPLVVLVILADWANHPQYGIINIALSSIGLPTNYWLGSKTWAFPMVIFLHIWTATPFFAVVFLSALQSIPKNLYEAVEMDGANILQAFRYITLPHLSYISMILVVMYTINWFNSFTIVFLGTGGGPVNSTEVLATYVYQEAFQTQALGYAASVGTVMLVLLLIFTIIYVVVEGRE